MSETETARESGSVTANGLTIAYQSFGPADREAVLLIAGWGAQLTMWPDDLCHELVDRGYRVIRFDNRDVGLSTHLEHLGRPDWEALIAAHGSGSPLPLPYRLEDMAEDTVALLEALHIERAHVVGASMGGMIAQLLALDHPQRVRSLTLVFTSSGNPEMPGMTEEVTRIPPPVSLEQGRQAVIAREIEAARVIGSPAYPTPEADLRRRIETDIERAWNPEALERQTAAVLASGDRSSRLRHLDVPTFILHGDSDRMVPDENARDLAALIPNARLQIAPGLGHDIPVALVDVFADAIVDAARRASEHR